MANNVAPSCPVSFNSPRGLSAAFGYGLAQKIAAIPRAHDLQSAIRALNLMETIIQQITYTQPVTNNIGQEPDYSVVDKGFTYNPSSNWTEHSRDYHQEYVRNPEDPEQFVAMKRIVQVSWMDKFGHSINYTVD